VGSYSGLSVTSGATTEQLTARLGLNASLSTPLSITATSNTFDVIGISLPSTLLPGGTVGVAYSTTITASNGSGSYIYTVTGTLPAGITLNSSTGVLSGTPTAGGTFNITVTATDSTNASASQQYTLTIAPPTITITPATLPAGTYGSTYSQSVSASGGTSSYTYALAAGSSLPPGLSLNTSTGAITGSPAAVSASAYTFTITATDSSTGTGPYRGSQNFSLTINKATQTISFALSSPVTYGVTPITLSATGGGSGNAVTFSLVSGPGSITGSTLTITGAGTVVVTANQAGSANYTAAAQVTKSIVVNQAATAVRLACGSIPIFLQSAFTLSATVSSSAGTPTGSVSFLDGSTPLGSGTVSGGVVAMTITSMAMGSHSITAAYSGDTNFLASTSGTLTQMVEDFSVSVASSGSTQTTRAGGTATYPLVVTPMGGATLPSAVTLNVSGLPTGATATFTPQVVPAGSSTSNVVLTIQLPSVAAKLDRKTPLNGKAPPLLWGILLLPLAGSMQRVRKRLGRKLSVLLLIVVGVAAMAGLSGCSSTSGFFDQLTNSYTIAVTGTSGTLSHSTSVTLTVQ
jgi:hypothetical protein